MIPKGTIFILTLILVIGTVSGDCIIFLDSCGIEGCGCDEGPALQAAFNNASANAPCKIIFPRDVTIIFGQSLYLGPNIEIDGNGSTLKVKSGLNKTTNWYGLKLGEYNYVHNLKYDGNRQNILSPGYIHGIYLNNSVVLENNELTNTTAYSVSSYNHDNWSFRNNFVHDGSQYGISPGGEPSQNHYSDNIVISDNVFWNITEVGIKIKGTSNATVFNNTIIVPDGAGFSSSGIRLYSADYSSRNVTITGNTISGDYMNVSRTGNGTSDGIDADNPDNPLSLIENNAINSTYKGIAVGTNGTIIRNNIIRNSRYSGIWISSNENQVINNTLTNSGVMVESSSRGKYNVFRYNTISGGNNYWRAAGDAGYLWKGGSGNIFDFNQINATRYGININYEDGAVWNTTISNNTITAGTKSINVFYNNTCSGGC